MSAVLRDNAVTQLRVPPQSVEAEQAVLGGLMLAPDALARLPLSAEDFYRRDHQQIFRAICELERKGQPYDAVTLADWFDAQGLAAQVEGGAYLTRLATTTPSAANIAGYAGIVRDKAVLRQMIEVGTGMVGDAFEPDGRDSSEILDAGIGALMGLAKQQARHEYTIKQAVTLAMAEMQEAHAAGGALRGVPSGFGRLDNRLGGFHPGDLVLIGARPKMGKTAMLVNMIRNAARKGVNCGVISGEQSAVQLAQRFLALETSIAGERMRNGQIAEEEWSKLTHGVRMLLEQRIQISDTGGPTIDQVRRLARKWKQEHGIKALYVDYLQRIRCRKSKDRTEEVGEVARGLKDIARECEIPVIAAAQVKRDVETRTDKRPDASDIANSDEATREADQILMLYREEVYYETVNERNNPVRRGIAELNLEANRHGPTGNFDLVWQPETMRFADLSYDEAFA